MVAGFVRCAVKAEAFHALRRKAADTYGAREACRQIRWRSDWSDFKFSPFFLFFSFLSEAISPDFLEITQHQHPYNTIQWVVCDVVAHQFVAAAIASIAYVRFVSQFHPYFIWHLTYWWSHLSSAAAAVVPAIVRWDESSSTTSRTRNTYILLCTIILTLTE